MLCCREARPPLTSIRKKIIENYLLTEGIESQGLFETKKYSFPKEDNEGFCVFFDRNTRRCRIHMVKPETCVAGPITFDINLRKGKIEWYLKIEKICPLAGATFEHKEVALRQVDAAKRECLALVQNLSAEELKAISNIEEPETFEIGEDDLDTSIAAKLKTSSPK